jgi:MOSC domain-containing protein YiiM
MNETKLISVNVGLPRQVISHGKPVLTGIFKSPLAGRVLVRALNLDGDRQADLSVHGGSDKAVYAYPAEHYPYWRAQLPEMEISWGMFGENFTVQGFQEAEVRIGDKLRIGSALFRVTQPRLPCYKLGIRFGRDDMVKRFIQSRRTGFYLRVLEEGDAGAGDSIEVVSAARNTLSVADIASLYDSPEDTNRDLLERAVLTEELSESWRSYFQGRLSRIEESKETRS